MKYLIIVFFFSSMMFVGIVFFNFLDYFYIVLDVVIIEYFLLGVVGIIGILLVSWGGGVDSRLE